METSKQDCHIEEVRTFVHDLHNYINPPSVNIILDVGSRDAMESVTLKDFYPNANIYAFECNPPAIELCKKNIGKHSGIVLVPNAVSDVNGTLEFFAIDPERTITTHKDGNIGASSLFLANPEYPHEKYHQNKITVESVTLSRWAKHVGVFDIDILWIDLQGAELRAFRGMEDLISHVKVIYTEVEFREMYLGQPLFNEINQYLLRKGFVLIKLYPYGWFGNALYVRKDLVNVITRSWVYIKTRLVLLRLFLSQLKLTSSVQNECK